jgi:hypothetical protein
VAPPPHPRHHPAHADEQGHECHQRQRLDAVDREGEAGIARAASDTAGTHRTRAGLRLHRPPARGQRHGAGRSRHEERAEAHRAGPLGVAQDRHDGRDERDDEAGADACEDLDRAVVTRTPTGREQADDRRQHRTCAPGRSRGGGEHDHHDRRRTEHRPEQLARRSRPPLSDDEGQSRKRRHHERRGNQTEGRDQSGRQPGPGREQGQAPEQHRRRHRGDEQRAHPAQRPCQHRRRCGSRDAGGDGAGVLRSGDRREPDRSPAAACGQQPLVAAVDGDARDAGEGRDGGGSHCSRPGGSPGEGSSSQRKEQDDHRQRDGP